MWTFHTCKADAILFSQFGLFFRWDLCLPIGLLIGAVVLGIWAIARIRRWRAELEQEELEPTEELTLEHYQKMVEDGLLDPQEFARIKARMEMIQPARDSKIDEPSAAKDQPPDTSFRAE